MEIRASEVVLENPLVMKHELGILKATGDVARSH
jgi:hypothetical protein